MNRTRQITVGLSIALLAVVAGVVGFTQFNQRSQASAKPCIVATTDALVAIAAKLDLPLVGVPTTKNALPKRYQAAAKIGSPMAPNLEKIAALKPTDVFAVNTLEAQYSDAFKTQKLAPEFLDLSTLASLKQTLTKLGKKFDRQDQAEAQVKRLATAEAKAAKRAHGPKPRVLILMGMPGAGYMIATQHSYVGDLVQHAGGINVYADDKSEYLAPNNESLATKNPDVILRLEHALPGTVKPQFDQEFKTNPLWAQTKASQTGRIYDLQQPLFNATATIQAPAALAQVSQWLYP